MYNPDGNIAGITDAVLPERSALYGYDSMGRLTLTVAEGAATAQSNVTSVTDPRDVTSTRGLDALGRLVSTGNPDGGVETHSYNKRDEALSFKDAIDVTTSFVRNGFGEVIEEVSPDRGASTFHYDAAGRLSAGIDGRGQRIDYGYDIAGRLLSKAPVGRPASEAVVYAYDSGGLGGHQTGRLTSVSDGTGVTLFGYDHRGNMTERQQSVGTTSVAVLAYSHDLADRVTAIAYPSGREVRYVRDAKGRVSAIETRASSAAAWTGVAAGLTYQPFGAVESMSLTNGLTATNERGLDGRLKARRLINTAISTALSDLLLCLRPRRQCGQHRRSCHARPFGHLWL